MNSNRRSLLKALLYSAVGGVGLPTLSSCGFVVNIKRNMGMAKSRLHDLGPLLEADKNGIRLPAGFTSRIIAESGRRPVKDSEYEWHWAPDGGSVFDTDDGGWIYVSNSEVNANEGRVGALRFAATGENVAAYSILKNSSRNCGGGATPWGTWLSCEETRGGIVWECDPTGINNAAKRPALGVFSHEAACVDRIHNKVYLTEDRSDGCLYRFTSTELNSLGNPDLGNGYLEVARINRSKNNTLEWLRVPDPSAQSEQTRYQLEEVSVFNGGEGICYHQGMIYFATKGDNRIWQLNVQTQQLSVLYDDDYHSDPQLTGVDCLAVSPLGDLVCGEDQGDMQIVAIDENGYTNPILQIEGHPNSEITGVAFTSRFDKLYFSSQRGSKGTSAGGITYEVVGPFLG